MSIFNRDISTEQEDIHQQMEESIWVLTESGELVKMEDIEDEND